MKRHLSWDGTSGICANNIYTWGALFKGVAYKPVLSMLYDKLEYSEEFNNSFIEVDGKRRELTTVEIDEIKIVADNWLQPLGQEGNPDFEQAYNIKENEIAIHAESLINAAYGKPHEGIIVNSVRYKAKSDRRKAHRVDKIAGELTLTQAEKDEAKIAEKLSGYGVKITNDQDKAETNLHKLNTANAIMAFDVLAENWSIWTPPV